MREREGLITRILQIRRSAGVPRQRSPAAVQPNDGVIQALEERVTHLEQMVQGLQDSVHRESLRYGKRIGELEAQIQPAALSKSLSKDARERGL